MGGGLKKYIEFGSCFHPKIYKQDGICQLHGDHTAKTYSKYTEENEKEK